jgi:hypothetical protein
LDHGDTALFPLNPYRALDCDLLALGLAAGAGRTRNGGRARVGNHGDNMRARGALGLITLSTLLTACGGGSDLLLPGASEPASVTLLQGNDQNGRVGQPLPQPLVVAVADAAGRPVEGATVVFVLTDPAPGAAITPDTVATDANGKATAQVQLGTRPGTQAGQVMALGGTGAATATAPFTLNAVSANANGIAAVSGQDQSGPVGSTLANPLVVRVADTFGNPIQGVAVAWSVEGGGSVSSATTTTDASGETSVQRTLGETAGTQRTLASVDGLAGSPVAFVQTATAGAASGVSIVTGNGQTGPVSTELSQPLVVEVRDAQSNVVAGVAVAWVIGTGGGSVSPATSTTDQSGRATAAWTLGSSPGANTLSAVVSGIGVAQFSATAVAGAANRLSIQTQPSTTAVSGVALSQQPVIQLIDAQGNPATQSGVQVTATIASGGGTLGGSAIQPTDGNGRATFTDLSISGPPGPRTLRFTASRFAAVTSTQIDLGAVPTVTTIVSDAPDPSTAGAPITVQFTVTSSSGTPTGSVTVADGSDTCSGTLSNGSGSCSLTLTNSGSRTLTASYAGDGGFGPSSDTESHVVQAAPAPTLALAQQPSAQATIGVALAQQPVVQLESGTGGALTTPGVSISVAIASGGGTLSGTTTQVTDAQGRATFTDLAIGGSAGSRTLVFTTSGFTSVTSTAIDVQPAAPSSSQSSITASPASIAAGGSSTIVVTVRDASGQPLGGRTVTADAPGAGNSITPGSVTSGADGTASFTFSSTAAGTTQTISASADGTALGSTTVTVQ